MSALGHERTLRAVHIMSALPPRADFNRWPPHLGFCAGRRALQVSMPSGSYVRVMKDRLATIYAKVLFFSTWPFKNEF